MENNYSKQESTGAIAVLEVFAWLDLFFGILGAIIIWANYGTQKIANTDYYYSSSRTIEVANPLWIGIGVAVLFQGVFLCAFFLVVASMAENLKAIRKNTQIM